MKGHEMNIISDKLLVAAEPETTAMISRSLVPHWSRA
jgi:hypothetical protein